LGNRLLNKLSDVSGTVNPSPWAAWSRGVMRVFFARRKIHSASDENTSKEGGKTSDRAFFNSSAGKKHRKFFNASRADEI
jgi:hypothetical protein